MSFGGGFGGFGSNNNNNQSSGFGGFGAQNNNTGSGFGSTNTGGFGAQNTNSGGGGMFGGGSNTGGGFGTSSSGGFGSNTNSGFGSKPAFGSSTTGGGGGIFGSSSNTNNTQSTGFGGFGTNTNNNTTSSFGGNTGGGLFGSNNNASKPAFGSGTTGGSLFGGTSNTTNTSTGFGGGGFGTSGSTTLGGGVGDPPGTAVTPFQAHNEKEANNTNQSNSFQNILFQDAYKKWSAEELRLADYVQGRRHGNASGGGAFGVGSNFGGTGFGTSNSTSNLFGGGTNTNTNTSGGGLFGNNNSTTNNNTSSGFGATNSGFGNTNTNTNTGGGLFGSKPSGGLFGSSNNQTQQSGFGTNTGGAFGNNNNTTGSTGFGSTNTGGGGLFGQSQANKPSGGLFGSSTTTNTGFGNNTNTGFGTNTNTSGGGLFGNTNTNNQQSSGGLFGANNNQQQQQNTGSAFGGFGAQNQNNQNQNQQSGGLFGNAQQKPAGGGIFGSSTQNNAGGGLFGNTNNQQQQSTGFGATNNQSTGGGLFGNKPSTGTGLFGNTNTQTNNAGTGLFGAQNNQNQQSAGTGLFGGANSQQQKPSLFGTANQNTGTGLFGNQNTQTQGSSLFNSTNQQQQNQGLGNSLMGASQQANNTPQGLTANLNDVSAYGSPSLFANVGGNEVANPGPLATPVNGSAKPKRGSILPMYKMAPGSASRFATPQKRGFGFSYSTYGTPGGSPASSIASTPGTNGRSLLAASASGSLSKSMSTNNLRRNFNTEDSILAPGAFSASSGPRWYGSTGSKKLIINREIRNDLFSTPQKDGRIADTNSSSRKLSKRVSFDTPNAENEEEPEVRGALPAPSDSPSTQAEDTPRQNRTANGSNGSRTPEADRSNGELTSVREEETAATPGPQSPSAIDLAPGEYWTEPSLDELRNMNRVQRQRIDNFVVGRVNVGSIAFKMPVDISGIEIEDLCGGIVQLEPRSATVYPVAAKKPPMGRGLNVPAQISLEQSWPRGTRDKIASDPRRFNKHVERLKRIPDTTFEKYDKDTGIWVFSVEHFTTYGLDESEDESDDDTSVAEPMATEPVLAQPPPMALDVSLNSSMDDDTFQFRQSRGLPGAFDEPELMVEDVLPRKESFLGVSSADSAPNDVRLSLEDEYTEEMEPEYDVSDDDLTRSSVGQHLAVEHDDASSEDGQDTKKGTPGGILRARMRALKGSAGPVQLEVADGDDWTEMLRKTVSPAKRDRRLLREMNEASPSKQTGQLIDFDKSIAGDFRKSSAWRKSTAERKDGFAASTQPGYDKGRGFATSIDLMNSLFEKPKPASQNLRASTTSTKGFPKWPYERQDKTITIDESEKAFHDGSRPTWGPDETLVVTRPLGYQNRRSLRDNSDILAFQRSTVQSSRQTVRLANFSTDSSKKYLRTQNSLTDISVVDGVPVAELRAPSIKDVFHHQDMNDPASIHEKRVWELASILFDGNEFANPEVRKTKLSNFWTDLVDHASSTAIGLAGSNEEKAVACLAGHRITEACKHLVEGRNFRLATLVPLIGTSDIAKKDMKEQVKAWHDSKMLSEFTEPLRAIYELLSGNVCVCEGMKGVPVEDRMESFVISKKFGLDWKQAFGLRLWYAISQQDDLAVAVKQFQEDIDQDREGLPQPWYLEQGIQPLWNDYDAHNRQDLLWGLLQLYADDRADLEAVLRPENSQLSPLDMRVCWQLGLALVATGKLSFGKGGQEKADAATVAYASQLTSAGEWLEAIFVLLHLSDPSARKKAVQDHLCRHAGLIGSESDLNFSILTEKFSIPSTWVWEALALYMRGVKKDPAAEVHCLLKAGAFVEAHRVLAEKVAPLAIIERGYAELSSLMAQFQGHQDYIPEWQLGGEIYTLFLTLLQHRSRSETAPRAVLDRLLAGLHAMSENASETEIMGYAALSDMADETAKEILKLTRKKQDVEFRSRILKLPLTQDRLLAYSVDLGMERYKEVMSH